MQSKTPKNERIKIRVQPLYSIIVYYFLGIYFLVMLFLPKLFSWEQSELSVTVLCCFCFSVFAIICFFIGTLHIQFGIIYDNNITIRDLFHIIAVIKRDEIVSIDKEKIITYDSRAVISLNWFVLKTDEKQRIYKARINRKNIFPILIIANKKNEVALKKFMGINLSES